MGLRGARKRAPRAAWLERAREAEAQARDVDEPSSQASPIARAYGERASCHERARARSRHAPVSCASPRLVFGAHRFVIHL
jgi:hypothetical protein